MFAKHAVDLRATLRLFKDLILLTAQMRAVRDVENWKRLPTHKGELTNSLAGSLGLPVLVTDADYDKHDLEQCEVGITECDALVAQTGTVIVTSCTAAGRASSVLPPPQVVIVWRELLVPDLPAAFVLIKSEHGANYPNMISFITGPSRTGGIERILVFGAHGPKKLTIFCV